MREEPKEYQSDADLIWALRQQGPAADEAIRFLYRHHYRSLSQYVQDNNGNKQDAEDVFQEAVIAFVKLVREEKFRGEASARTLLFALNRNLWLNELKRRKRSLKREQLYEALSDKDATAIDKAMVQQQSSRQLMEVMAQLGEDCKKILVLFYYENKSMRELLEELDFENEQVVRNKKYKCLKKLTELIHRDKNLYHQLKTLLHE